MQETLLFNAQRNTRFKAYPLEVKSSKYYTFSSINAFNAAFSQRDGHSITVHPKTIPAENEVVKVQPILFTFVLERL